MGRKIETAGDLRKLLKDKKAFPDSMPLWVSISRQVERGKVEVTSYKAKRYQEMQIVGSNADA